LPAITPALLSSTKALFEIFCC